MYTGVFESMYKGRWESNVLRIHFADHVGSPLLFLHLNGTHSILCFVGFGIYNYPNKFFQYEGEWKRGKKHGMLSRHFESTI